ncbi:MAG: choice-of-anchor J domain-containing protein, partial [Candidatus Krumholzibacteriaceae bacterium]
KIRPRNVGTNSANLHACGDPPAAPTNLVGADTPKDAGESITLTFARSFDEVNGEKDIEQYTVYRRADGEVEWTCINAISPTGAATYTFHDDTHTPAPAGGPVTGTAYYYMVTAWDCRPQESDQSNIVGPITALANGPQPPAILDAYDTPCDAKNEITVVIRRSSNDSSPGGTIRTYQIYRGSTAGGGILSKTYVGSVTANGSTTYTWLDNPTNNLALTPPVAGSYYTYIARAMSLDTIPSINSNEYGPIYYSGSISACQITSVDDYPDDDGTALTVNWKRSPSETCTPSPITMYEVMRKSLSAPVYITVYSAPATNAPTYAFVDNGLTRGTQYTYCVYTHSVSLAVPSNEASGTPLRNTELDPPEDLTANDIMCDATGAILVTFTKAPQDVAGGGMTNYNIYRRTETESAVKVGELDATKQDSYSYTDGPVSNPSSPPVIGDYYYYFATSNDRANSRESGPSNEGYTMSDGEPAAPHITNAADTPMDNGRSITVAYDRSADDGHCTSNVITYRIYRELTNSGGFSDLVGTITATGLTSYTFYDDQTHSSNPPYNNINYYYCVRAYDGTKESVNSNIVGPVYASSQNPSSYLVFTDDFETSKGWTHGLIRSTDDWQWGTPMGKGGQSYGNNDPTTAHSGTHVWGNNLGSGSANGQYTKNEENYLMSPVLNCWVHNNVVLQFYRWLNVEGPAYDQAYVEISTTGTSGPWTVVWQNPTAITDNAWTFVQLDLHQWADYQSAVYIRFRLKSDGQHNYGGWNIDDVVVREKPLVP